VVGLVRDDDSLDGLFRFRKDRADTADVPSDLSDNGVIGQTPFELDHDQSFRITIDAQEVQLSDRRAQLVAGALAIHPQSESPSPLEPVPVAYQEVLEVRLKIELGRFCPELTRLDDGR